MRNDITALLDFISRDQECQHCLAMAIDTYFRDVTELLKTDDLGLIARRLGPEAWSQVYPGVLEFFFSNEYEHPDGRQTWNVIDDFLARGGIALTEEENGYLRSLRHSHMSLYEVKAVDLDHSLTVVDLIDKKPSVVVQEKKMTHCVQPSDILGLRVLAEGDHHVVSGGGLRLSSNQVAGVIENIRFLHGATVMMSSMGLGRSAKDKAEKAKIERLSRVMWAPEIASAYMLPCLEQVRRQTSRKSARSKKTEVVH